MAARIGEYRTPSRHQQAIFQEGQESSITTTNSFPGLVIDEGRGEGSILFDIDGNEYLDFGFPGTDNFGCGSCLSPIKRKLAALTIWSLPEHDVHTKISIRAKQMLAVRTPVRNGLGKVAGVASGSDANEWAMDIARQHNRKRKAFACFEGAFHGRNYGIRGALDPRKPERIEGYQWPYTFIRFRFPSERERDPVALVEEDFMGLRVRNRVNAFFIELVQGEGGVNVAQKTAIQRLVELCRAHNILVVIDEVQTGMGRTGKLWSYEHYGVVPDIVTIGKSLSGGIVPTAAVVARADLDFKQASQRSSTFGIEPGRAAAILGAFEVLDGGLLERVPVLGAYLHDTLEAALGRNRFVRATRGLGLMQGIEFWYGVRDPRPFPELRDMLLARLQMSGVLVLGAGISGVNPTIRLLPPLVITRAEIDLFAEIFIRELAWVSKNM